MKKLNLLALAAMALAVMTISACSKNAKTGDETSQAQTELAAAEKDAATEVEDADLDDEDEYEADVRDTASFAPESRLQAVPFSYDKYDLSEEARNIMKNNAGVLNTNKNWTIVVEGYCDNRGTTEYNLSLGQKRAKSVRDYYVRLGVPADKIGTISYGVENPICTEDTEECWKQNRRAETKVK
ncbi:MAG: OmpA family protein [Elusimicrobiales bacterium]|nr:OmpA family protein [Elusimicrobiales bacterium]